MAKMIPPRLPIPPTAPETMPFFFLLLVFVLFGGGGGSIPLAKGWTCGTTAKLAPLHASRKNARPAVSPNMVASLLGLENPSASWKAPIPTPRKERRIFLDQTDCVCR